MKKSLRSLFWITAITLLLLGSVTSGASAAGAHQAAFTPGGGDVLPPTARPHGYSLIEAAAATAYFNTGPRTLETLPQDFPFQILYITADNTFTVRTGTMFYVPVLYSSDVDAALWPFPDVTDPVAVTAYYFDPAQLGAEFMHIIVDGKVNEIGPGYAVGAVTPGLPDGGNTYTVAAAFLTPLSKGVHYVTIEGLFSGAFLAPYFLGGVLDFSGANAITYTVIVH